MKENEVMFCAGDGQTIPAKYIAAQVALRHEKHNAIHPDLTADGWVMVSGHSYGYYADGLDAPCVSVVSVRRET